MLFGLIVDQVRPAVCDDRAVVGAVVHPGSGEHQAIELGHGDAYGQPFYPGGEHRCGAGGAVQVQRVADASVQGRQHPGLAVDNKAEMAVVGLVEDRVRGSALVRGPLPHAARGVAVGTGEGLGHGAASLARYSSY